MWEISEHYDQIVLLLAHQGWGDPNHFAQELVGSRYHFAGRGEFYDVSVQWYTPP